MTSKQSLAKGSIDSSAGTAPDTAWQAASGEVDRPKDLWIEGKPANLMREPTEWLREIASRVETAVPNTFGLRVRFSVPRLERADLDIFRMTKLVLDGLPWKFRGLFVHAEFMTNQEQGLYLAWDNRPPALITQVWLKNKQEFEGELPAVVEPAHLNVLLHEKIGFQELWNDGTLNWMIEQMATMMNSDFPKSKFHELSLARHDSKPCGISVGIETVREEQAAEGGFSLSKDSKKLL